MSTAKTSWRVHFTDSDLATLLDLTQRQKEHADAKVNRLTDPREKSFYSSVSERLAAFREKLSTMEPGDTALSDLDLKWLSGLVTREQRHTQERFDAARQRVCKEAITLGGQLERLYSLSYQLSKPLSRKASGVARRLKAEEAAAEQLRQEEIARKKALLRKPRFFPKPPGSPSTLRANSERKRKGPVSEQLSALEDLFKS